MKKISNYWNSVSARATDFKVGDWVMRYDGVFPGVVVGVHPGINFVDIEYPLGIEREEPEELILLTLFSALPPSGAATKAARKLRKKRQNRFHRLIYTMNNYSGLNYASTSPGYDGRDKIASAPEQDIFKQYVRGTKIAGLSREQRILSMVQDYDY